ncbi:MAG: glycosyltransferase family 4 protein [Nitrospiraceae bacterium]|nr:glycosyltransferase family 4 protein [Nitrospiraceae bacterium]
MAHNYYRLRGGEDAVAEAEVALLQSHGHEVEFVTRKNSDIDESSALTLAMDTIWSRQSKQAVDDAIRRFHPDVVHIHNTFPMLSPAILQAAWHHQVPVVMTLHNFRLMCIQAMFLRDGQICEDCMGRLPWRGVLRRCYRRSMAQSAALAASVSVHRALGTYKRAVSRFVTLNEFCRDKFVEGGLPFERISVKPNFVDAPPLEDTPREGGLFVGRLSPEKGISTLAEAMHKLAGIRVDVLGEGPEAAIASNVDGLILHGNAPAGTVRTMMLRAAYLVMPSIWYETFGMVAIEAFSCALPVIASDLGAMQTLIDHGRTGLLFKAGSADELAETLRWAEANPRAMRDMGAAARAEYEARYTPDINYRQLMGIYEEAIVNGQR